MPIGIKKILLCGIIFMVSLIPVEVFAVQESSETSITTAAQTTSRTKLANRVVADAKRYLGVPYKLGANYNRDGSYKFDCSSFTQKVFADVGIKLPRTVTTQTRATKKIPLSQIQVGDLMYFDTDFSGGTNHVGIYIGNGQVIHASTAKGGKVQITNVYASSYWKRTITYATRVF